MRKILLVLFGLVIFTGSAEARHRHTAISSRVVVCNLRGCNDLVEQSQQVSRHRYVSNDGEIVAHPAGPGFPLAAPSV